MNKSFDRLIDLEKQNKDKVENVKKIENREKKAKENL